MTWMLTCVCVGCICESVRAALWHEVYPQLVDAHLDEPQQPLSRYRLDALVWFTYKAQLADDTLVFPYTKEMYDELVWLMTCEDSTGKTRFVACTQAAQHTHTHLLLLPLSPKCRT